MSACGEGEERGAVGPEGGGRRETTAGAEGARRDEASEREA